MAAARKPGVLRATATFWCELDGVPVKVVVDEIVPVDDPVVAGREELFEPVSEAG